MRPDPERARLAAEALARARADAWARGDRPGTPQRQQSQPQDPEREGPDSPSHPVPVLVGKAKTRRPPAADRRRRRPPVGARLARKGRGRRRLRPLAGHRGPPAGPAHEAGVLRRRRANRLRRLPRLGDPGPPHGPPAPEAPSGGTGPRHRPPHPGQRPRRPPKTRAAACESASTRSRRYPQPWQTIEPARVGYRRQPGFGRWPAASACGQVQLSHETHASDAPRQRQRVPRHATRQPARTAALAGDEPARGLLRQRHAVS